MELSANGHRREADRLLRQRVKFELRPGTTARYGLPPFATRLVVVIRLADAIRLVVATQHRLMMILDRTPWLGEL